MTSTFSFIIFMFAAVIIFIVLMLVIGVTLRLTQPQSGKTGVASSLLEIDPDAASDPQVLDEIRAGRKINAIKRYRELTGAGLKEAKDAVEYIEAHPDEDFGAKKKRDGVMDDGLREMLRNGQRADAIETYRRFTGASLADAKDAIERIEMELTEPFEDDDSPSDGELPSNLNLSKRR